MGEGQRKRVSLRVRQPTMATRYYKLSDDVYIPGRGELGTPSDSQSRECGSRLFLRGTPADVEGGLLVPIHQPGKALESPLADAGAVHIVTEKRAALLPQMTLNDV